MLWATLLQDCIKTFFLLRCKEPLSSLLVICEEMGMEIKESPAAGIKPPVEVEPGCGVKWAGWRAAA